MVRLYLVSSDVELPLTGVCVSLQQHGAHAEDLLHHRVLTQVVLTLFMTGKHNDYSIYYHIIEFYLALSYVLVSLNREFFFNPCF